MVKPRIPTDAVVTGSFSPNSAELRSDGDDTSLPGAGLNYLVRGHDLKVTADWSRSPRGARPATSALTLQTQVGF